MNNQTIQKIAMQQSAFDSCCEENDFKSLENKVVFSQKSAKARNYLQLPFLCDLTSYGNNIVASVSPEFAELVGAYLKKYAVEHCFETPNLHWLMEQLHPLGMNACFMAEYWLPDVTVLKPLTCGYELKLLRPADFANCYLPQWDNALCEARKSLDKLAIGAYDKGALIGLAGCSEDCNSMWQIGVDVLPQYRKQGVASCLTAQLALEILKQGKVPFYCCAWSNLKSVRNAIKSGFKPAWIQLTVKSNDFITKMNA